jgi:hypothetical protein
MKKLLAVALPVLFLCGCSDSEKHVLVPRDVHDNVMVTTTSTTPAPAVAPPVGAAASVSVTQSVVKPPPSSISIKQSTSTSSAPAATRPVVASVTTKTTQQPDKSESAVAVSAPGQTGTPMVADPMLTGYVDKIGAHLQAISSTDLGDVASRNDAAKQALAEGKGSQAADLLSKNLADLRKQETHFSAVAPGTTKVDGPTEKLRLVKLVEAETALALGLVDQGLGSQAQAQPNLKTAADMQGFPDGWALSDEVKQMQKDANDHMKS